MSRPTSVVSEPVAAEARPLYIAAVWGVLGFAALLIKALWQLVPLALEPIRAHTLTTWQVAIYGAWVLFMAYSEGYKGFQLHMAPRVAARGMYVASNPQLWRVLLAPLFCMGLFHATRRRLIVSWVILIGVIALVVAVRFLDQPWRGIVDGGVVVGLGWGLTAVLWSFYLALTGRLDHVSPEVPSGSAQSA